MANCKYKTLGAAGEYMSYSNEGYAVISYIVDAAAGMPLEQFLNERVFGPIGMTRTVLDIDGSEARKIASDGNITSLFEEVNGQSVADDCWSILPPFRACACVKSTAHDMARYYSCLGNGGVIDGVQAIPAKAVEIMVGHLLLRPLQAHQERTCYMRTLRRTARRIYPRRLPQGRRLRLCRAVQPG